jgi:hypothetical protein
MSKTTDHPAFPFFGPDAFRRFIKQGAGSIVFRSKAYSSLRLMKHCLTSYSETIQNPSYFKDVHTYCMFIGHNKSGTSMIGALLDAHPNVILADEADALEYISAGFHRDQIFYVLLAQSQKEFKKGRVTARRLQAYSYLVPGQWQGRHNTLGVIGDSTSGSSTQRFATEPNLLQKLVRTMQGVNVRFIHVIRNPYDPISVMMVRGRRSFENAIEKYFSYCETLKDLQKQIDLSSILQVKYEDFVYEPEAQLTTICRFLGIEPDTDYLHACANIIRQPPVINRDMVPWDKQQISYVAEKIKRFDFLQGYSFIS